MASGTSGKLKKAEQAAIAAENARLQLRLGRAAHGYGVIAAMVLTFNAILAYLMEVMDIFADPPFSSAVLLIWALPMMIGIGIGAFALMLKWDPYSYERRSAHFIFTWLGTVLPVIGVVIMLLAEFGILQFEYLPWIYPVSLLGLSLTMISMALTWRGKGLRKVTSIGSSVIPIVLLTLIMVMSPLSPSYLPLVMGYLGSAICYQLSGSMLHVLASSTSAQKRQIIRASGDKTATMGKELNSRHALLERREKSLLAREAHLESYDKELSRAFMYIESRRKELHEFQAKIDKREHSLLSMEKRIGALKADADAKMSELEIVKGDVKAQSEKSKQMREDLGRMAATLQRRESKFRRREIQLDAKARELTSLEKAMGKERKRHDETRTQLNTKRENLLARERELDALERGTVTDAPASKGEAPTLEEWEKRLKNKEDELEANSLALESRSTELKEWKAELEERGAQLAEGFEDLNAREGTYVTKESELADRESKLQESSEAFEMDRTTLNKDSEQLKGLEENLRQLSAEARKKATDYDSLKEELETKEIELQHKSKTIAELEESMEGESKSLGGRMEALIEREKLLEEKEARMRLAALEAAKGAAEGADPEEREKAIRLREERLRTKERDLKNRTYQREKELELREKALQQKLREDISDMEDQVVEEKKVEKVRTGITKLDDLMYGGIPFNSNVLFIGPSFLGKEVAILNFIAEGLRKGIPAVMITTSKPPQEIARDMTPILTEFVEYERIGLVKWIDATSQIQPDDVGFDESKRVYRVNGAADLGNILEGLHEIEDVLGEEHAYFRIAYLSLSPSVSHSQPSEAYDFIQRMVNELRKTRFVGAFALEKGMHDQREIETIEHQMDGAVIFKEEDTKTFLSVQGVCDVQTREWVQYTRTDRGLIIGAFSLERIR
jgi:KaiC/GvpD/RAD55 family RecA-like ATPase